MKYSGTPQHKVSIISEVSLFQGQACSWERKGVLTREVSSLSLLSYGKEEASDY